MTIEVLFMSVEVEDTSVYKLVTGGRFLPTPTSHPKIYIGRSASIGNNKTEVGCEKFEAQWVIV